MQTPRVIFLKTIGDNFDELTNIVEAFINCCSHASHESIGEIWSL